LIHIDSCHQSIFIVFILSVLHVLDGLFPHLPSLLEHYRPNQGEIV